jgi:hypothetical protein
MELYNDILIEKYFTGSLTAAEQQLLEQRLETEPAFKAAFDFQVKLAHTLDATRTQEIKAMLQEEAKQLDAAEARPVLLTEEQEMRIIRKNRPKLYALAAAVAFLLIAAWFFLRPEPTGDDLYAAAFTEYKNDFVGRGDTEAELLKQANTAYAEKRFEPAADAFAQLALAHPDNSGYAFYQGLSLLQSDGFDSALPVLEKIAAQPASSYRYEALWYIALTHTRAGRFDQARSAIDQYLSHNGKIRYEQDAKKLKKQLP